MKFLLQIQKIVKHSFREGIPSMTSNVKIKNQPVMFLIVPIKMFFIYSSPHVYFIRTSTFKEALLCF